MNILKFYVLHFSVREDLWPYSNAYVRPGTGAKIFLRSKLNGYCLHLEITLSSLVSKKGPWKLVEQVVKGANFL